jgi:Fur family ferric uptake transcriptional regulator
MNTAREMGKFVTALRERGIAATPQRLALADTVFSTHRHLSADELFALARSRGARVGRVTVYRTLRTMVEAGLVAERTFDKNRLLYEHTVGHRHHDHMVCVECRKIVEFENPRIEREQEKEARSHGFTLMHHSHVLFGQCAACRRKAARRKA